MGKTQYKGILVFAEQREGVIQNVAFELTGKARDLVDQINEQVTATLCGYQVRGLSDQLIHAGAGRVLIVDGPSLKDYLTEQYVQAVYHIITVYKPEIALSGAITVGRDLAPRLSARLRTELMVDYTSLKIGEGRNLMMTRPTFGGNLMATILCNQNRPQMSTVHPGVTRRKAGDKTHTGEVEEVKVPFDERRFKVCLAGKKHETKSMIDITEASVLVSGGCGVGTNGGFDKFKALAQTIKAEISSSCAMVDAGIIGHERQVGQTGKTVRPDIYFACGISGAIQHPAGMEESEYIIAINKDKFTPIFQVADLGIVGDLHEVLPVLTERLKTLQANKK